MNTLSRTNITQYNALWATGDAVVSSVILTIYLANRFSAERACPSSPKCERSNDTAYSVRDDTQQCISTSTDSYCKSAIKITNLRSVLAAQRHERYPVLPQCL